MKSHKSVMSVSEKLTTAFRVFKIYGLKGVFKIFQNEKKFLVLFWKGKWDIRYSRV
ncbi:MAG: hypothetical protein LBE91_09980 [Tannerella sp.]|nr:hypothetical protein [Tannerella sp.]